MYTESKAYNNNLDYKGSGCWCACACAKEGMTSGGCYGGGILALLLALVAFELLPSRTVLHLQISSASRVALGGKG